MRPRLSVCFNSIVLMCNVDVNAVLKIENVTFSTSKFDTKLIRCQSYSLTRTSVYSKRAKCEHAIAKKQLLECGPMPNVMVALQNIGGALCSTPQSLADAHYVTAVQ